MITNQKINVWDVEYSKLSHVLKFTVEANMSTVQTMEDICQRTDMTMDEIAKELGQLLHQGLRRCPPIGQASHYHRRISEHCEDDWAPNWIRREATYDCRGDFHA